jgi:hypothetical protein
MKIIKQAGFAHRRSRATCAGSETNSAAWVAMNASRRFPPNSACQWVSTPSPAPVSSSRLLAGADWMKKLTSDTATLGTARSSTSASIISVRAERSRRSARMSGRSPRGRRPLSFRQRHRRA